MQLMVVNAKDMRMQISYLSEKHCVLNMCCQQNEGFKLSSTVCCMVGVSREGLETNALT